jgi:4-amino-4-deoxy-L-arabinose transferase-like glycosyltransferase
MPPGSERPRHARAALLLALGVLALLGPFLGKPFHIDDPLFLWTARHLRSHPFDFYGFTVAWYETAEPMWKVTQNPPLACYYLAAVMTLFGSSEIALHAAMLLPAWGVLWGTYRLAERFGIRPLPAALFTLVQPVFLLCSSSVMCDTLMLCAWVWTVLLWDRGLREQRLGLLYAAGVLIAVTTLTKYFGISLSPLLGAYSLAVDRRGWWRWLWPLCVAGLILLAYDGLAWMTYGRALLGSAMVFANSARIKTLEGNVFHCMSGMTFVGGCLGGLLFLAPALWGWRGGRWLLLAIVPIALLTLTMDASDYTYSQRWWLSAQFILWATLGLGVLGLAAFDLARQRDARALLLFLWVVGTYVFAAGVNWTINGRSILPMVPAVGMLVSRRLEGGRAAVGGFPLRWVIPLIPSAALAVLLTYADDSWAKTQREAATQLTEQSYSPDHVLWYEGHWGFQYYVVELGKARFWDVQRDKCHAGDTMIVPENNTNIVVPPIDCVAIIGRSGFPPCPWLAAQSQRLGAGFYTDIAGPLPFAFGEVPPDTYLVLRIVQSFGVQPP